MDAIFGDAVEIWGSWRGKGPAVLDYDVLDALPDANREESASYKHELTGVIPNKSDAETNRQWWSWAEKRDSWHDGLVNWNPPPAESLAAQNAMFERARKRIMANRAKSIPTGNESVMVQPQELRRMIFGNDDVTWGNPNLRVEYADCKSKYTGRASLEWERNESGKWVHYYRVQQGNRKPVEFGENEITHARYSANLGHWVIQLPHKDRT